MNYYNENTNKIRRRKVSSKDSVSRPISSDNSIERKKNINSIKSEEIKKRGKLTGYTWKYLLTGGAWGWRTEY